MEKLLIASLIVNVLQLAFNFFLGNKNFAFKDALTEVLAAGKDGKVTEEEFQSVADKIITQFKIIIYGRNK